MSVDGNAHYDQIQTYVTMSQSKLCGEENECTNISWGSHIVLSAGVCSSFWQDNENCLVAGSKQSCMM
jgi:hypothetical protein